MKDLKTKYTQEQLLAPQSLSGAFQSASADLADYVGVNIACSLADQDGALSVEIYDGTDWTVVTEQLNIVGATLTAGVYPAVSGSTNDVSLVSVGSEAEAVRLSGYVDAQTEVAVHLIGEVKRG